MMDLAHAFHHSWRSLADIQAVILAGNLGNKPGSLKPLDNLKVFDLRKELQAKGVETEGLLKPQLISTLTDILQGAQRVPTLLTLNPTQSLSTLNLSKYEILDCEPLQDIKGHLYNLLPELPQLLPSCMSSECQQLLDTTLPKQKVSGAFLKGGYDGRNKKCIFFNNNVPLSLENSHNLKKFFLRQTTEKKQASFSSSSPSPITSSSCSRMWVRSLRDVIKGLDYSTENGAEKHSGERRLEISWRAMWNRRPR